VKHNRFFRILAVAVVLSLLMIAIPATPVLAGSITLNIEEGEIGTHISIEGENFTPASAVYIYFSSQVVSTGDEIDDEVTTYYGPKRVVTYESGSPYGGGSFSTTFDIPDELNDGDDDEVVHGGTYYIYTTYSGDNEILTIDEFTIIGISQLTPAEGSIGTSVKIEGVGFEDRENISLKYDGVDVLIDSGDSETDSNGDFVSYFTVPAGVVGAHTVTAKVEDKEGDFQFTVLPAITVDPPSGAPCDQITVNGTGFGSKKYITITFDGNAMNIGGDDDTDKYGSFESTFNVPEVEPGTYEIEVKDDDNNKADIEFGISTSLALSSGANATAPSHVGEEVTLSGSGFRADWQITITYASTPVTFITNSLTDGSFSYTFEVPPSAGGMHVITVTDGENTDQTSFFVESTPPALPTTLLPEMDTKADSKAEFDWADVSDASLPMTYELQVATNSQFTADSILVNKIGLPTSDYTLSDAEELESAGEEAPYYWRVRAKDAASNAGEWTSGTRFTVGTTFSMPGWLIYTLIAIGAIAIFFLGLWLGKRSTTSEDYW
jgi:hypothetical protein